MPNGDEGLILTARLAMHTDGYTYLVHSVENALDVIKEQVAAMHLTTPIDANATSARLCF